MLAYVSLCQVSVADGKGGFMLDGMNVTGKCLLEGNFDLFPSIFVYGCSYVPKYATPLNHRDG